MLNNGATRDDVIALLIFGSPTAQKCGMMLLGHPITSYQTLHQIRKRHAAEHFLLPPRELRTRPATWPVERHKETSARGSNRLVRQARERVGGGWEV